MGGRIQELEEFEEFEEWVMTLMTLMTLISGVGVDCCKSLKINGLAAGLS